MRQIERITLNQIVGNNNEFLNEVLDNGFNLYKSILGTSGTVVDTYKEFIKQKLYIRIKPLRNWLSMYDLDTSKDMLLDLVNEYIPEFITNTIVDTLALNKSWINFDTLGLEKHTANKELGRTARAEASSTSSQTNKTNYQGFNVSNQQGQFNTSSAESTASNTSTATGTDTEVSSLEMTGSKRLEYIKFLQDFTSEKIRNFVSELKRNMLQLIY